jgi:hypothetical protein
MFTLFKPGARFRRMNHFQTGKGYIWVLANMQNVVYVYRPNRDGDWLQELEAIW